MLWSISSLHSPHPSEEPGQLFSFHESRERNQSWGWSCWMFLGSWAEPWLHYDTSIKKPRNSLSHSSQHCCCRQSFLRRIMKNIIALINSAIFCKCKGLQRCGQHSLKCFFKALSCWNSGYWEFWAFCAVRHRNPQKVTPKRTLLWRGLGESFQNSVWELESLVCVLNRSMWYHTVKDLESGVLKYINK